MDVYYTVRAARRIELIHKRWKKADLPYLFKEELRTAEQRILDNPHLATPMKQTRRGWTIRAVLLPKTEQWVYYRIDERRQRIVVYTVWGARRRRRPALPG